MDKTLTIGIVLLVIVATATAGFFLLTKNQPNENLIGGQTDEHGCLGACRLFVEQRRKSLYS